MKFLLQLDVCIRVLNKSSRKNGVKKDVSFGAKAFEIMHSFFVIRTSHELFKGSRKYVFAPVQF